MLTRTAKRYVIALSIVVFLVALYTVVGFWAVPHFLRSGLTDFVNTHYQRKVSLGDIRFNPYTFTLDVADFSLPDTDGEPMLAFGRLHVDLERHERFVDLRGVRLGRERAAPLRAAAQRRSPRAIRARISASSATLSGGNNRVARCPIASDAV